MSLLIVALTLLAPPQEEKFVPKSGKDPYLIAVRDLKKAIELISDDPGAAIDKVNTILSNAKIRFTECRLKIEIASADYDYQDFFPYQVRGRARLALGRKAANPDSAEQYFKAAIEDFKTSADKKVPGSAELKKDAETELDKAIKSKKKDDPIDEFRRAKFSPALRNDKYRTALAFVTGPEGQVLTEEQRQMLSRETEDLCRDYVSDRMIKIRGNLDNIRTLRDLKNLQESGYRQQFLSPLPPDAELTETAAKDPSLVWMRKHTKTLRAIQTGQIKASDVFEAAHEALATDAPDAEGENPWFKAMSLLAASMIEETISECTRDSEKCLKADRQKRQADAEAAFTSWKEFVSRTDKKVVERHGDLGFRTDRLDRLVKEFPVELAQLASFDIQGCFRGDPLKELKAVESGLQGVVDNLSGMGRVAIESRQELYTKLITAGTLWRMMEGKQENDIVRELSDHRAGLKSAGGPINPEEYGPKVKKVFDGLKM